MRWSCALMRAERPGARRLDLFRADVIRDGRRWRPRNRPDGLIRRAALGPQKLGGTPRARRVGARGRVENVARVLGAFRVGACGSPTFRRAWESKGKRPWTCVVGGPTLGRRGFLRGSRLPLRRANRLA